MSYCAQCGEEIFWVYESPSGKMTALNVYGTEREKSLTGEKLTATIHLCKNEEDDEKKETQKQAK